MGDCSSAHTLTHAVGTTTTTTMNARAAARTRAAAAAAAATADNDEATDDNDNAPEHLSCLALQKTLVCYVCHSLPAGRIEQCANGHFVCAEAGRAWQTVFATSRGAYFQQTSSRRR